MMYLGLSTTQLGWTITPILLDLDVQRSTSPPSESELTRSDTDSCKF